MSVRGFMTELEDKIGLLIFFMGRGSVAPPSDLIIGIGSGSRVRGFGRHGRSLTGFRRGKVPNLSAVALVSRAAAAMSKEVIPPLIEVVRIGGEFGLGRRPKVANRSSVRLGGVDGLTGVTGLLIRTADGCLPDARNDLAAGEEDADRMLLLRLGPIGLSGVLAFRLDG